MQKLTASLCFSLVFYPVLAAGGAPISAIDTYISARDQAAAQVCALKDERVQDSAADQAIGKLKVLFAAAVPAWSAKGFQAQGQFTLFALCRGSIEYGQLDGWAYQSGETTVTVTSLVYLKRWLFDHRNWWATGPNPPVAIPAAFHNETFYTLAISTDAAAYFYSDVLVRPSDLGATAVAKLVLFSNGEAEGENPDTIVTTVVRGDSAFIARQKLAIRLVRPALCKKTLEKTLAQSVVALKEYQASLKGKPPGPVKDVSRFNDHLVLEEQAGRDYRTCFAAHFREQPHYKEIIRQAQVLVDLLQ